MNNEEKMKFIADKIGKEELLAAAAEEATELAQALLKLRRVYNKLNCTPKTDFECIQDMAEEMADVELSIEILMLCFSSAVSEFILGYKIGTKSRKLNRWVERLEMNSK